MNDGFKNLPTDWIILDQEFTKILAPDVSRISVAQISRRLESDRDARFIVAECHYKSGAEGKEYFIQKDMVKEGIKCSPNKKLPELMIVRQIYKYGIPQMEITA